jgi:polar amino acid transport system substrate-binding protein
MLTIAAALALAVLLGACSGAAKTSNKLLVGTSADYPPYEFIILDDKNEQQYVGVDIELAKKLASDAGKELEIVNMNFDNLMVSLQKGDIDAVIACIEPNEERKQAGDFSDAYYVLNPPLVLIRTADAGALTSVESLAGKNVGAQTGTTKADIVTDDIPDANLVAVATVTDLVNQLSYDKVDAIVLDYDVAMSYANSSPDFAIADIELGIRQDLGVAVQKGDPKGLLPSFNKTIAAEKAAGNIDKWMEEANAISADAIYPE